MKSYGVQPKCPNRTMFHRSRPFRLLGLMIAASFCVPLTAAQSVQLSPKVTIHGPTREVRSGHAAKPATPTRLHLKPNVILITIDTLRADHVGCYGATNVKTPTLDGLARDGVVFERAISQVPLTWPSHAVILTGTYPFKNGLRDLRIQP